MRKRKPGKRKKSASYTLRAPSLSIESIECSLICGFDGFDGFDGAEPCLLQLLAERTQRSSSCNLRYLKLSEPSIVKKRTCTLLTTLLLRSLLLSLERNFGFSEFSHSWLRTRWISQRHRSFSRDSEKPRAVGFF